MSSQDGILREAMKQKPNGLSSETVQHIVNTYGSRFSEIFQYCTEDKNFGSHVVAHMPVTKAEVVHGVRKEMAQTLSDVVFRRTELGTIGHPGTQCLHTCAMLMAKEMKWDERRIQSELYETNIEYRRRGVE
jgi:glycerol-3-phosphate dehydrogenase